MLPDFVLFAMPRIYRLIGYDRTHSAYVARGKRTDMTLDLYDESHYFKQLDMEVTVVAVGKTCVQTKHAFYTREHQPRMLWSVYLWMVSMDKKTWRPKPLQDSIRQTYPDPNDGTCIKPQPLLERPTHQVVYECERVIEWSSADEYGNVHNVYYDQFAHDAASELCVQGQLMHFKGDLAKYRVIQLGSVHVHRSSPGDRLRIYVWQDEDDEYTLHFHMCEIATDKLICQISLSLHPVSVDTISLETLCDI